MVYQLVGHMSHPAAQSPARMIPDATKVILTWTVWNRTIQVMTPLRLLPPGREQFWPNAIGISYVSGRLSKEVWYEQQNNRDTKILIRNRHEKSPSCDAAVAVAPVPVDSSVDPGRFCAGLGRRNSDRSLCNRR